MIFCISLRRHRRGPETYILITGFRIQFPVYTFYFLYSSCGCSSKGLPAIWGLTVSVSTTLKVTLQPTSEVAWLSPWVCIHLQTIFSPPFLIPPRPHPPFFNDYYFRTLSGRGGVFWCKRLLLWRRVGGPQQTSTKLGFLRLGKCEGGGGGKPQSGFVCQNAQSVLIWFGKALGLG